MNEVAPVVLWQYPSAWGLPNLSPFCMKLEAWLRLAKIPYERRAFAGPARSKTKKAPYIVAGDALLYDSSNIIEFLRPRTTLDSELTVEELSELTLLQRTVEEHLYWVVIYDRWLDDAGWKLTQSGYFGKLPRIVRWLVTPMLRRAVRRDAKGHGLGRLPREQIAARLRKDLQSIETRLGESEYYFSAPSTADAILIGFFGNVLYAPVHGLFKEELLKHPSLLRYTERTYSAIFPDFSKVSR